MAIVPHEQDKTLNFGTIAIVPYNGVKAHHDYLIPKTIKIKNYISLKIKGVNRKYYG